MLNSRPPTNGLRSAYFASIKPITYKTKVKTKKVSKKRPKIPHDKYDNQTNTIDDIKKTKKGFRETQLNYYHTSEQNLFNTTRLQKKFHKKLHKRIVSETRSSRNDTEYVMPRLDTDGIFYKN